ncbi:flap endonuclease GEN-like 1 [Morus notabilis]|uniref:flap endonuclease GEN-like 1 n=1 Tax=Morus notabilis TaxID=981085 RepID=UPI000CED0533|nr:flap endonuclease GEN-like 1 [Morus notabilis]
MGVGGKFWDLLKPYARNEGFDFMRNKRVVIDLSFWIVQHETALKSNARNPHLRLTFLRTINLFSKFGAFPVFVIDGTPSPLKSRARIARFYHSSGIDLSSFPAAEDGVLVERNRAFVKCVQECVELLELFGMPVLKAKGEGEALCSQLDREGHVDACITSDSDAFLFGATCVIKGFRSNSKEPFECYCMSDIEAGLGLKREQLIAISLLVGNDHDISGVQGIGLETALRFVQTLGEDEILTKLRGIGNKSISAFQCYTKFVDDLVPSLDRSLPKKKLSHCSFCGHPGSKRDHLKNSCKYCSTSSNGGCKKKPEGFKCGCMSCDVGRKEKERKKQDHWFDRVSSKIALEPNFPNREIIEMYLCDNHGSFTGNDGPCISWRSPKIELLVDFLAFHQRWEPSYIRQRMLPMLSTIFLREMAAHQIKSLLYGQYDFDSIDRVKVRHGHTFYVIKWSKATPKSGGVSNATCSEVSDMQQDVVDSDESVDLLDEMDAPMIHIKDGCQFILTDENVELVHAAFPRELDRFLREKELKESRRKKTPNLRFERTNEKLETPKSRGIQRNITEFYRSTKVLLENQPVEDLAKDIDSQSGESSKEKRKVSNQNLPKSVRRRLLFG